MDRLPRACWRALTELLGLFEEWGWPQDLKVWRQPHIPKDETDVPKVERLRPLAIAAVCVRAWNRFRADQLSRWVSPSVPSCMAGGFAGRTVEK
eukprot:11373699-Alexandrium_andersonii.AAC.1